MINDLPFQSIVRRFSFEGRPTERERAAAAVAAAASIASA